MNTSPIHSKIVRIGNSRGVRIPRSLLEQAGLEDDVEMSVHGNRLVIEQVRPEQAEAVAPVSTGEIAFDERGRPVIAGTTMKVIELVVEHLAYGWSPEELKYQHPYLSLGQVYAALTYYWNHQQEMDQEIVVQDREYNRLRAASLDSPVRRRLKAQGLI
jgi:uncharacterized protein (DUF433 family)/antitoxin component of MazEF toxin-antitoxin module